MKKKRNKLRSDLQQAVVNIALELRTAAVQAQGAGSRAVHTSSVRMETLIRQETAMKRWISYFFYRFSMIKHAAPKITNKIIRAKRVSNWYIPKKKSVCACVRLILVLVWKKIVLVLVWGTYLSTTAASPFLYCFTMSWWVNSRISVELQLCCCRNKSRVRASH